MLDIKIQENKIQIRIEQRSTLIISIMIISYDFSCK